jgi:hypothetical protein
VQLPDQREPVIGLRYKETGFPRWTKVWSHIELGKIFDIISPARPSDDGVPAGIADGKEHFWTLSAEAEQLLHLPRGISIQRMPICHDAPLEASQPFRSGPFSKEVECDVNNQAPDGVEPRPGRDLEN